MSSITSEITAGSGAHGDTPRIKQEEESYRDLANAVPNGNQQQERLSASPQIKQEASAAPYEAQNTATVSAVAAAPVAPVASTSSDPANGQILPDQPNIKIIHRNINGYVGFANLPKQWHRRSIRKGFNFNLLCVGCSGLGKTTLINSLFNENFPTASSGRQDGADGNVLAGQENDSMEIGAGGIPNSTSVDLPENIQSRGEVSIHTVSRVIEENGVKLKLTVIEAPGFGDAIDNSNCWDPIIQEINSRFDQYLDAENRIERSYEEDNRIHACLYFIEPTGHFLKPLDIEFCSMVYRKCNLIPVIAKSDILTDEEIKIFKQRISRQFLENGIEIFRPPIYKLDDKETVEVANKLYDALPYAVVGSNSLIQDPSAPNRMVRAREYPWGIIKVDDTSASDFTLLRDLLIKHYLEELRERTSKVLYERYRSAKLISLGIKQDNSVFREFDPSARQEEEKKLHEAKLAKLEAEMKNVFQQKVAEKEKKLQKSETELFARHKEMKEKLTKQLKMLEDKKRQLEMSISSPMPVSPVQQKKKGFLR